MHHQRDFETQAKKSPKIFKAHNDYHIFIMDQEEIGQHSISDKRYSLKYLLNLVFFLKLWLFHKKEYEQPTLQFVIGIFHLNKYYN